MERLSTLKRFNQVSTLLTTLIVQPIVRAVKGYASFILNLQVQAGLKVDFTRNPLTYVMLRTLAYPLATYLITYVLLHSVRIETMSSLSRLAGAIPYNYLPVIASILAIPAYPLLTYLKAVERGRKVESELKYFIICESIVAAGDPDLVEDLSTINEDIFPTLSRESAIFRRLRKLMTVPNVVSTYCRWIRSRFASMLLKDYVFAASLGIKRTWLREKGNEVLEDLRVSSLNAVKARTLVSILLAVVLGYVPPIVVTMATLLGQSIIGRVLALTLAAFPVFFIVTPKPPTHFRMFLDKGLLPLRVALLSACVLAFLAPVALEYHPCIPYQVRGLLQVLWKLRTLLCVGLLAISLKQVRELMLGLKEAVGLSNALLSLASAPLGMTNALSLVKEVFSRAGSPSLKELSKDVGLGGRSLGRAVGKAKLWLTKYVIFAITRILRYGVFNRESIMKLRELATEMMRQFRTAAVSNLAIVALCVGLPYILTYACSFSPHLLNSGVASMYAVLSTLLYSTYVSYVVFDDPLNTLLPAVAMLELSLIGGASV